MSASFSGSPFLLNVGPGNISRAPEGMPAAGKEVSIIKKAKRKKQDALCRELQQYCQQGLKLWLNGAPSSPRQIAKACATGEECGYMRDYIRDENDKITGIGYDHVSGK